MIVKLTFILAIQVTISSAIVIDPETVNVTEAPTNCEAFCTNRRGNHYCCRYLDENGEPHTLTEDEKPGECKKRPGCQGGKKNLHYCNVDVDCPGNLKCCSDRCGSLPICLKPKRNRNRNRNKNKERKNKRRRKPNPSRGQDRPGQVEPPEVAPPAVFEETPQSGTAFLVPSAGVEPSQGQGHHFPTVGEAAIRPQPSPGIGDVRIHTNPQSQIQGRPQGQAQGLIGQIFQGFNTAGVNIGGNQGQQQGFLVPTRGQTQTEDGTVHRPLFSIG